MLSLLGLEEPPVASIDPAHLEYSVPDHGAALEHTEANDFTTRAVAIINTERSVQALQARAVNAAPLNEESKVPAVAAAAPSPRVSAAVCMFFC